MTLSRAEMLKLGLQVAAAIGAGTEIANFWTRRAEATNPVNDVVFPNDLLRYNDDLFFIKFTFKKYEKRSQASSSVIKTQGPGIKLPMPKSLRDNLSVQYDSPSLGSKTGVITDQLSAINDQNSYLERISRSSGLDAVLEAISPLVNIGTASVIDQFGDTKIGQAAQALTGVAPNPYQTWLFKHPNFRDHSFNWTLAPTTPGESIIIRNIIHLFQKNMLPAKQDRNNALLLQYPSIVYPQLFAGSAQTSSYLYDFKPCVIKSVSVDYAGAGKPAFFTTNNRGGISGAPAIVNLSIQLQEIEFWTADNIPI
jgi:hypothetical protein